MSKTSPNEPSGSVESRSTPWAPLLKKDIPAFLDYAAEHCPLLIEIFDRVERELIREGVDLSGLAEGDLTVFQTQRTRHESRA
ncbi:hypothetical protein [Microbacterium algeriense]|uniref:Uncharacterized protein n=1 Tax=Microbacterium algeriense TaxID=2615184 RepID=A0ABQ6V7B4_9MICO|nr:hypothetical protein [Microbacterium algeriense]KAB1865084.1 hypothetical protein F6A08_13625 [Microbacterium algeriense]